MHRNYGFHKISKSFALIESDYLHRNEIYIDASVKTSPQFSSFVISTSSRFILPAKDTITIARFPFGEDSFEDCQVGRNA